ncbi:hypothetical protein C8J56DRAFT_1063101 [Mycena floridula]|nr:hypothetical protein C8J56DRAFT_1063101 [Mycena floridula]
MYHGVDVAAFMKELIGNFPPSPALVIVFIRQAIGVTLKWVSVDWDLRVILGDDTEDHDFSDAQIIRDFMIQCDRPDVDTGWTAELGQCEMAQGNTSIKRLRFHLDEQIHSDLPPLKVASDSNRIEIDTLCPSLETLEFDRFEPLSNALELFVKLVVLRAAMHSNDGNNLFKWTLRTIIVRWRQGNISLAFTSTTSIGMAQPRPVREYY